MHGHWLGKLWALPNSIFGLLIAAPGLVKGARLQWGHNALQVLNYPWGCGALCLGHVVIYARCSPQDCGCWYGHPRQLHLARHEQAHTLQAERLGPLFVPVYLLCGGISARNPFEQAANAYAEGGHYWPWRWNGQRR